MGSVMRLLTDDELTRINRSLEREFNRDLVEARKMLRDLLTLCLNRAHEQLVKGQINLSQYYADTQLLATCAERLRDGDERN